MTGDFRDSLLGGAVNTFDLNISSGQLKYPEGRNPSLDDDESYTKLVYSASRLQDWITGRALVYFNLRGQYAANNLDTTEQFRLGGPDGVRAFATGEGTGDLGVIASLELRLLPPESWFGRIARDMVFSLFADGGYVQYRYRQRIITETNPSEEHRRLQRRRLRSELGAARRLLRCASRWLNPRVARHAAAKRSTRRGPICRPPCSSTDGRTGTPQRGPIR